MATKRLTILLLLLSSFCVIHARLPMFQVKLTGGYRSWTADTDSFSFHYINEDDIGDTLSIKNIEFNYKNKSAAIGLCLETNYNRRLYSEIFFEYQKTDFYLVKFGTALGINKKVGENFIFRPKLRMAYSRYSFLLGEIEKTGPFIKVDVIPFYNKTVEVREKCSSLLLEPAAELIYRTKGRLFFSFAAGFQLMTLTKRGSYLEFMSGEEYTTPKGKNKPPTEDYSDSNVYLKYGSDIKNKSPINPSGLTLNISVGWSFGHGK